MLEVLQPTCPCWVKNDDPLALGGTPGGTLFLSSYIMCSEENMNVTALALTDIGKKETGAWDPMHTCSGFI